MLVQMPDVNDDKELQRMIGSFNQFKDIPS